MLDNILTWDREATLFINGSDNVYFDQIIYYATSTWSWVPLGVVLLWLLWKNLSPSQFSLAILCLSVAVIISNELSSSVFKPLFQRWRPTQDPVYMYMVDVVHNYRGGRFGFFSAHASNTFSVATFLAYLFRHKWLNVCIVSWAMVNCYTRLYLGVHYLGDVLVGTCFGVMIGYAMAYLFRKFAKVDVPIFEKKSVHLFLCAILASYCLVFIVAAISFL